jgi:putative acetyltransferase
MKIALERPDQPDVVALIDALDAYQKPLYPPQSHHGIDLTALLQSEMRFAVVRSDVGTAVGCGAIMITAAYGELKRMYLQPEWRGRGLAQQLLDFLEAQAALEGCARYVLETGIHQHAAVAFYEQAGYVRCPPFGDYQPDPLSVFMCKDVGAR